MKFAWLIAAHDRPEHLRALLDRVLLGTGDIAVVHMDARSAIWRNDRAIVESHPSGRAILVQDPVGVRWGRWSLVTARRRLLERGLAHDCDYYHHISGKCWPIAARSRIVADIERDGGKAAYMTVIGPEADYRMQGWWPDYPRWLGMLPDCRLTQKMGSWLTRGTIGATQLAAKAGLQRSEPYGPWQKGWDWWSLPHDLAQEARDVSLENERSGRLVGTAVADEHLLPTYFHQRHPERLRDFRRFVKWRAADVNNPELLRAADLPEIQAGTDWIARKFDSEADDFFLTAFAPYT